MTDARAPHKCTMNVQLEVHELNKRGECDKLVSESELKEAGIKSKFILVVKGETKKECLKKIKELMKNV